MARRILGRISCAASAATLNSLVVAYGLTTIPRDGSLFDVVSLTQHSDPVVERDLFALAMHRLGAARSDGWLPEWREVS
jgi:hypothetical protein